MQTSWETTSFKGTITVYTTGFSMKRSTLSLLRHCWCLLMRRYLAGHPREVTACSAPPSFFFLHPFFLFITFLWHLQDAVTVDAYQRTSSGEPDCISAFWTLLQRLVRMQHICGALCTFPFCCGHRGFQEYVNICIPWVGACVCNMNATPG